MSPGATFERVYLALKQQLMSGAFAPGEQLEPSLISGNLAASITPVRDALHRLVGERLVHTPRNNGFRVPVMTEAALRDLYAWNGRLLQLALSGRGPFPGGQAGPTESTGDRTGPAMLAERTAGLFLGLARVSASAEHVTAVAGLNDRLNRIRISEHGVVPGTAAELEQIEEAWAISEAADVRKLVAAYHRRRGKLVPVLLAALQPNL